MPDQFKETTRTGYGKRIIGSVKGVFIGIILFIGSFALLYWNEGRVDVSQIAQNAVEISSTEVAGTEPDGGLVSVAGIVNSQEQIGDGLYLKPGDYLSLSRVVEIYAWTEQTESTSETKLGGSEETETTYSYIKEWVSDPTPTSSFRYPGDHENLAKTIDDFEKTVSTARVGVYDLDMDHLSLPGEEKLSLSADILDLPETETAADATLGVSDESEEDEFFLTEEYSAEPVAEKSTGPVLIGNYIYVGKGSLSSPEVGDMRISYQVLKNNTEGTVIGKLDGLKITTYVDEETGENLYRMFTGSKDQAVGQLHGEYKFMLWVFRILGFLMMWIGLSGLFGPISVLLDVVPFFGSISRSLVGGITFVASVALSAVTILVSMILHNVIALIIAVVVTVAVILFVIRAKGVARGRG
ncbi:MAG: TMEM43 family protein [Candidatus Peregrinibacteria bacterium]